jgi:uncharacterized protein
VNVKQFISLNSNNRTLNTENKVQDLKKQIAAMGSAAVAFSGGVDSTLILKLSRDVLGEDTIALTAVSASLPKRELQETIHLAKLLNVRQILLKTNETGKSGYLENSPMRCFHCKNEVYGKFVRFAKKAKINYVLDGTNADDVGDFRPGRDAAAAHDIRSPLVEAGLTKAEVRKLAKEFGLPNWNKPSAACLSSRIPYGTQVTVPVLSQIEHAEDTLRNLGFKQLRVRHHQDLARIEVNPADFLQVFEHRELIVQSLKEIGYAYITIDLAGFRSGSLNETLNKNG